MQTLFGARLGHHAENVRGTPALVLPGRDISYAELSAWVHSYAAWLACEGCFPGEVVGLTIAEEIPHLVASLALLALGVPQVCLPTHEPASKKRALADRLEVRRVVVTHPDHALSGRQMSLLRPQQHEGAADGGVPNAILANPDAPAVYYTSSGTTGEPKIFAHSQRALAWRAERLAEQEQIGPGHRSLTPAPIEYTVALRNRFTVAYQGFTSIFPGDLASPHASLLELCVSLHVTALELSVLQVASLVEDRSDMRPLPPHTIVRTVGSPVSARLRQQFKRRFDRPLVVDYGALEFGRISSTYPDPVDDDLESVGVPVPWVELEIVDGDDKIVPAGEIGEVRVRSEYMVVREYYRDPVATSRHFRDGWFYPRDLGSLTPRGALCLYGRADDMMNLNGIKIFPAEIERVLEAHRAVKAAAAFPRTSVAHGDIPIAAVELHESWVVGADELLAHARELLGVRAPRKIIVLDSLPRNSAGKVVKRELADLLVADK